MHFYGFCFGFLKNYSYLYRIIKKQFSKKENVMGNDYQVRTKHGYDFFEVSSTFQKSIRRCDEKQAMYWAVELYESGYAKYAWKRMVIMSCEDVGLGDPYINMAIMNLKATYDYLVSLKERSKPEKLPFTQAVLMLVHAKKSRYNDLAICVYWQENDSKRYEIPEYAYDMHTRRGKAMGHGIDHFYEVAAVINNRNKLPNEDEMERLARIADHAQENHQIFKENISCTVEEANRNAQPDLFEGIP